jgi:Holliday junction resolvasome RuvABC endonuclease subunit
VTPYIIGVDYATRRIAIASFFPSSHWYPGDWWATKEMELAEKQDDTLYITNLAQWLGGFISAAPPEWEPYVVIEDSIQGHKDMRTGLRMSRVQGALASAAYGAGVPLSRLTFVHPMVWKKKVIGAGNASKSDIARWLAVEHPDIFDFCSSQDSIDAACIALFGHSYFGFDDGEGPMQGLEPSGDVRA